MGYFGLVLLAALWWLPVLIAYIRRHRNTAPIVVINFFLDWTFVGWVIALAWAVAHQEPEHPAGPVVTLPPESRNEVHVPGQQREVARHALDGRGWNS